MIEGTVEFTSKTTGKKEMVSAGEAVRATSKGLSEKTSFNVEKESNNWKKENIGKDYISTAEFKEKSSFRLFLLVIIVVAIIIVFRNKILNTVKKK